LMFASRIARHALATHVPIVSASLRHGMTTESSGAGVVAAGFSSRITGCIVIGNVFELDIDYLPSSGADAGDTCTILSGGQWKSTHELSKTSARAVFTRPA
jgi:hypothetical protein